MRAALAWTHVVSKCVAHRPGLIDLHLSDPVHTRKYLKGLSPCDRALMHKALNGTHVTQDGLKYCKKSDDDVCKFCGSSDSRFHRFWICPYFDEMRADVPPSLIAMLPRLPTFLTEYGWSLQPMTMRRWYSLLTAVEVQPFCVPGPRDGTLQLFTDGSCIHQSFAEVRFAAWAVISATADDEVEGVVLDCGHLPGLIQNAYRAEIFAVLRAVRAAHSMRCSAMIWSDCEGVVKRVRTLLKGGSPRVNSPNYDLWVFLAQAIADAEPCHFDITYVASHKGDNAVSPFEDWCFRNNTWADRTAVRMNYNRTSEFWDFSTATLSMSVRPMTFLGRCKELYLTSVGLRFKAHSKTLTMKKCLKIPCVLRCTGRVCLRSHVFLKMLSDGILSDCASHFQLVPSNGAPEHT